MLERQLEVVEWMVHSQVESLVRKDAKMCRVLGQLYRGKDY